MNTVNANYWFIYAATVTWPHHVGYYFQSLSSSKTSTLIPCPVGHDDIVPLSCLDIYSFLGSLSVERNSKSTNWALPESWYSYLDLAFAVSFAKRVHVCQKYRVKYKIRSGNLCKSPQSNDLICILKRSDNSFHHFYLKKYKPQRQ